MSQENRELFDDPFEEPVVGGTEPASRGISPEEMPYDRRPDLRSPYVWLSCRGPFKFERTAHYRFGPQLITLSRNATEAGSEGQALAPGTCAFSNRPLNSGEPSYLEVRGPDLDEFDGLNEWRKHHELARFEVALGYLSNLITRSDYVIELIVRHEEKTMEPASPARWVAPWDFLAHSATYIPFRA